MKKISESNLSYLLELIATSTKQLFDEATPPTATTSEFGLVKPDGTTITINNNGVISVGNVTVPVATSSTNGIFKPDDTTIGLKDTSKLYVKLSAVDSEEDPEPWFPDEEESDLPYIIGLVDGRFICLDKSSTTIGNDGFQSTFSNIFLLNYDVYTDNSTYEVTRIGVDSESSPTRISTSDFNISNISDKPNAGAKKINDFSIIGYYNDNGSGQASGTPPEGMNTASGIFKYIDSNGYSARSGYISKTGSPPTYLAWDTSGYEYNIELMDNISRSHSIYKRGMFSLGSYTDSDYWKDMILLDVTGYLYINNNIVHEFKYTPSYAHSTIADNGQRTTINDTANNSSSISIVKLKSDMYESDLYAILRVDNSYGIYRYDFSGNEWILLADLPEQTLNNNDSIDFYVSKTGSNPYILFVHKQTTAKKIVLYGYGLNSSSSDWTKLGQCIPELWKAAE